MRCVRGAGCAASGVRERALVVDICACDIYDNIYVHLHMLMCICICAFGVRERALVVDVRRRETRDGPGRPLPGPLVRGPVVGGPVVGFVSGRAAQQGDQQLGSLHSVLRMVEGEAGQRIRGLPLPYLGEG